mgnify:CR=1 FL=1
MYYYYAPLYYLNSLCTNSYELLTYSNNIEQSMRFLFSRMAEQNHKLPQNDLLLMLSTIKTQCKKIQMQITKILIKQVFYSNTIFFLRLIFPPLKIPDQVRSWDPGLWIRIRFCSAPDPRNQIQDSIRDGRFFTKKTVKSGSLSS